MTQNEAINYLKSSGMSDEQIKAISDAFTSKYVEVMHYLLTAEPDGYPLHKWSSVYGYVITVYDVIMAFNRIKEIEDGE